MEYFHIEWGGEVTLPVTDIWPNGDGPEDPSVADVIKLMRKSGTLRNLCKEWHMDIEGVSVNGKDSGLR